MADTFPKLKSHEKLMIYLFIHLKDKDKHERIYYFTQDAIATSTGIRVKYLARTVDRLKGEELVREDKKSIPNQRKRKVYFLTPKGEDASRELCNDLNKTMIRLERGDETLEIPANEVNSVLKIKSTLLDIVMSVDENGVLKEEVLKKKVAALRGGYVEHLDTMPPLKYFFGRKKELAELEVALKNFEFVLITGIAGIGKTTLTKKFVLNLRGSHNLFWYDVHKWTTFHGLVESMGGFFHNLGYSHLQNLSRENKDFTLEELESVLRTFIDQCEGVLIFDDFEKASPSTVEFFSMLIRLVETMRGIKVVMCARVIPDPHFYDRRDVLTRGLVYEFPLKGLDFESCRELVESRGITISTDQLQALWDKLGGHPLFFEVIQSSPNIAEITREVEDIGKYLYQEIYKSLSNDERKVMGYFSAFRHPVREEVLFLDEHITIETLERLRERALVVPEKDNCYETHDIVKEFFYKQLGPSKRKLYHQKAVQVYENIHPELRLNERAYHLIKSEEYEKAVEHLFSQKAEFIKEGKLEELSNQLAMIPEDTLGDETTISYLIMKAEVAHAKGNWDKAIELINTLMDYKEEIEQSHLKNLYMMLGQLYMEKAAWDNSLEFFDKAFTLALKSKDEKTIANIYSGKGFVHFRKGEHKESIENNLKCIERAKKLGDISLEVKACIEIGMSHVNLGGHDETISYYHHCLDLLKDSKDLYLKCRILNNMGVAHYMGKENLRALEYWERCMQLSSSSGNKKFHTYALMNTADLYAKNGEWEKAKENLDGALKLVQEMGDPLGLAYVYMNYGIYYKTKKNWKKAIHYFKQSINLAKEKSTPVDLADRYIEFGFMYKEKGDIDVAREQFQKALDIYTELGGKETFITRIQGEIEDLDKKNGAKEEIDESKKKDEKKKD